MESVGWMSALMAGFFTVLGFVLAVAWDKWKQRDRQNRLSTLWEYATRHANERIAEYENVTNMLLETREEKEQLFYQSIVNTAALRRDIALMYSRMIALLISEDSIKAIDLTDSDFDLLQQRMVMLETPEEDK